MGFDLELDYQGNYSPSIRVSGINIIGAPQSDFIVKYDQKDDYFKIYVLAGEVDLYRVSNSTLSHGLVSRQEDMSKFSKQTSLMTQKNTIK